MTRRKTLGKSTTIRLAVPIILHKRIVIAANETRRSISEFLRIFIDENLDNRKGVTSNGKEKESLY